MTKALRTSVRTGGLRQGGLQAGLGSDSIFATASLDLNFAVNKNLGTLVDATTGSNLVDHTRASSGTYVGSDGLIKTALTNLLTYSEDFSNAVWDAQTSATKVSATGVDDPAGGTTASTWKNDGTTPADGGIRRTISGTSGLTYTYSAWIRRRTGTGDISMTVGQNVAFDVTSQVTSEWNRISVTNTADANTRGYIFIRTPGDEIDIWGAQLEQSSTVGEYIPTTSTINSAPRFDHDPETGESLGLLVEESRTNLLLQSEDFATTWASTLLTDNVDATAAPNGTVTADEIIETTATNIRSKEQNITSVASAVYTLSVFAKAGNGDKRFLRLSLNSAASVSLWAAASYDLDDGTVASSNSAGGGTVTSTSIQPFGNGWYRCILTGDIGANADLRALVTLTPNSSAYTSSGRGRTAYTGDDVSSIYIWGAQLEAGSFPTSYIPTTDITVTRAADVASISGSNFSSWYNDNEGSGFIEAFTAFTGATGANFYRFGLFINGNRVSRSGSGTTPQLLVTKNSTTQASPYAGFLQPNVFAKIIAAYKVDDFAISTNGSSPSGNAVDTPGSVPQGLTSAVLMDNNSGCVRRFTYWPQRLPNETLQTITQ